jgi:hypothetical protein
MRFRVQRFRVQRFRVQRFWVQRFRVQRFRVQGSKVWVFAQGATPHKQGSRFKERDGVRHLTHGEPEGQNVRR